MIQTLPSSIQPYAREHIDKPILSQNDRDEQESLYNQTTEDNRFNESTSSGRMFDR